MIIITPHFSLPIIKWETPTIIPDKKEIDLNVIIKNENIATLQFFLTAKKKKGNCSSIKNAKKTIGVISLIKLSNTNTDDIIINVIHKY